MSFPAQKSLSAEAWLAEETALCRQYAGPHQQSKWLRCVLVAASCGLISTLLLHYSNRRLLVSAEQRFVRGAPLSTVFVPGGSTMSRSYSRPLRLTETLVTRTARRSQVDENFSENAKVLPPASV